MKLGLGTVQFGCNYGISNNKGQVPSKEVEKILQFAHCVGIDTIDSASMYGESEKILGQFDLSNFKVITKTIRADLKKSGRENVENLIVNFDNSLKYLNQKNIYGLLFHESTDLLSSFGNELWREVENFKKHNLVKKIGVSVYDPSVLEDITNKFEIDIVQLPLNLLDQRFIPILKKLKEKNIEIHSRSAFLQGLLLMKNSEINSYFDEIKPILKTIPKPRLAYALQFVDNIKEIDKIIVGTTCLNDLKEIVESIRANIDNIDYSKFKISDERFVLPQNWSLN